MPLPPKPDDGSATGSAAAAAERCSPPPPYFPGRDLAPPTGPPPAPPRSHSYVNDEDADPCYFQPINDEEAQLIGKTSFQPQGTSSPGSGENEYLIGRSTVDDDQDEADGNRKTANGGVVESIEMKELQSRPEKVPDDPQSPLSRQLAVEVVDDEDDDDIDVVNGRAVLYAIRRPSGVDT